MSTRAWRVLNRHAFQTCGPARPDILETGLHAYYFEGADHGIYSLHSHHLKCIAPPRATAYSERAVRTKLLSPHGGDGRRIVRADLSYGCFFPRMWRGEETPLSFTGEVAEKLTLAIQSARLIFDWAAEIFRVVQPCRTNRRAFGLEMRQLLLAACTEVESNWKAILKAHNVKPKYNDFSTRDYVRLLKPLRLNEWEVFMPGFISVGALRPFGSWSTNSPSKSLRWYDAYNATKHDRENNLHRASLAVVIDAVAAVYVMLLAQVGPNFLRSSVYSIHDLIAKQVPRWSPSEWYGHEPTWTHDPVVRQQPFGGVVGWRRCDPTWNAVNYPF